VFEYPYKLDVAKLLGEGSKHKYVFLRDGENILRFLPPWSSDLVALHETWVHYVGREFFYCPRYVAKLPCPVCEYVESRGGRQAAVTDSQVRSLLVKQRYLANVVDLNRPESGVRILMYPRTVHLALLDLVRDDDDFGDFTDWQKGYPIKITRTQSGGARHMRQYAVYPMTSKRGPVEERYLKELYNLFEVTKVRPYSELKEILENFLLTSSEAPFLDDGGPAEKAVVDAVEARVRRPVADAGVRSSLDFDPVEVIEDFAQ